MRRILNIPQSRTTSFVIIAVVYLLATAVGVVTYDYCAPKTDALWALFIADFAATVFTWAMGLLYRNVSVYDPYWSVLPPVMLSLYALLMDQMTLPAWVMLLSIFVWAIRLTGNWAVTFKGLRHEDWRYTKYRTSLHPVLFHLVNFFGLNMVPTIVVFLAMTPAFRILEEAPEATLFTWLGAAMSLAAVAIQHLSDTTAHQFRREHPGEVCRVGLWKHGRHPNYFGEILMWWGLWVQSLSMPVDWTVVGAISNTLLFLCVCIPLMEHRQLKNKPDYAQYRKETRLFI